MYDQVVSYVIILLCLHFIWGCCVCMCVCVCKWALTSASQILTDLLAKYTQFLLECSASSILEAWVQYNSIDNPRRTLAMLSWDARSNFVINRNTEQENVLRSLHFSSAETLVSATHRPPAPWSQATLPLLHFCCKGRVACDQGAGHSSLAALLLHDFTMSPSVTTAFALPRAVIPWFPLYLLLAFLASVSSLSVSPTSALVLPLRSCPSLQAICHSHLLNYPFWILNINGETT